MSFWMRLIFSANVAIGMVMLFTLATIRVTGINSSEEIPTIVGGLVFVFLLLAGMIAWFSFASTRSFLGISERNWDTRMGRSFAAVNVIAIVAAVIGFTVEPWAFTLFIFSGATAALGLLARWIFLGKASHG